MRLLNCILLVDDNRIATILQRNLIADTGITGHIVTCSNGWEALQFLESGGSNQHPPELILLDLAMPVMDGLAFLRTYKDRGYHYTSSSQIVVVSHSDNPYDKRRVAETGIAYYLQKPLREGHLLALAALCYEHQHDRKLYQF